MRVVRADALRQYVAHPGDVQNRAHGAAGDDARSPRRRLEKHTARAVFPHRLVGDGLLVEGHLHHRLAGLLHALADGFGHLVRLAHSDADLALPVADGHQGAETEAPAALHHLGHTVHVDDPVDEFTLFGILGLPVPASSCVSRHQKLTPVSLTLSASAFTRPW